MLDRDLTMVGSANLEVRSFRLNCESTRVIHG